MKNIVNSESYDAIIGLAAIIGLSVVIFFVTGIVLRIILIISNWLGALGFGLIIAFQIVQLIVTLWRKKK